jgi:hypothetical protein
MGRRRIYENAAARTRAYRARLRLRLEIKSNSSLPLDQVRTNPAAAATVLVRELGPETVLGLRLALDNALLNTRPPAATSADDALR